MKVDELKEEVEVAEEMMVVEVWEVVEVLEVEEREMEGWMVEAGRKEVPGTVAVFC